MEQFSGRTSAFLHKSTKWKEKDKLKDYEQMPEYLTDGKLDWHKVPHDGKPAIRQQTVFDAQWSDCPVEVEDEVKQLWKDHHTLGNDTSYFEWCDAEEGLEDDYPVIAAYLKSKDITNCMIHWWW